MRSAVITMVPDFNPEMSRAERLAKANSVYSDLTHELANLATAFLMRYDVDLAQMDTVTSDQQEFGDDVLALRDAMDARNLALGLVVKEYTGGPLQVPIDPVASTFEERVAQTQRIMRDLATAPVTPIRGSHNSEEVPRG